VTTITDVKVHSPLGFSAAPPQINKNNKEDQAMAFFYAPNDPSLSKPRTKHVAADNVVSLVTVLLLVAVAYGLYLLYAGPGPAQRTADMSAPPAVMTPKDPGLPTPPLQDEETRPTQAPIR
jgi:hypothetical protein